MNAEFVKDIIKEIGKASLWIGAFELGKKTGKKFEAWRTSRSLKKAVKDQMVESGLKSDDVQIFIDDNDAVHMTFSIQNEVG